MLGRSTSFCLFIEGTSAVTVGVLPVVYVTTLYFFSLDNVSIDEVIPSSNSFTSSWGRLPSHFFLATDPSNLECNYYCSCYSYANLCIPVLNSKRILTGYMWQSHVENEHYSFFLLHPFNTSCWKLVHIWHIKSFLQNVSGFCTKTYHLTKSHWKVVESW